MSSTPHERFELPRLPKRAADSHKGDFGRALVIGGSRGMAGAISLAAIATLRSGAGLVKAAVPASCQQTVASFEPSLMTIALPEDAEGRVARTAQAALAGPLTEATVVACGPGLGRSNDVTELVAWLYTTVKQPLIVDADGLNALAARPEVLSKAAGPRILTPHPGEFARLMQIDKVAPDKRESLAKELAARAGAVVVLKGHRTVVTDGRQASVNPTGNPGMATGGTGDVLTGVITGLVGQGLAPYDAARLGVYVHGLAGDLAAEELGQISLIAHDLLTYLPRAFQRVQT